MVQNHPELVSVGGSTCSTGRFRTTNSGSLFSRTDTQRCGNFLGTLGHKAKAENQRNILQLRWVKMAERGGFEPPIPFKGYTGLANQRLQPLGHLSSAPIVTPAGASGSRKFSVFSASHQPLPPAGPGLVTLRGQQPE